jgi:putative RNA 2'-phosphotransferase
MNENEVSKFLSYVLRHKPEHIDLELDKDGWGTIESLICGAAGKGCHLTYSKILEVVLRNDKKRFEMSNDRSRIRAVQGHSTKYVTRKYLEVEPPEFLYHGTAVRFLDFIRQQGLIAGARHHVHLTQDKITACEVGRRYGVVALQQVDSQKMFAQGYKFFKAENDVWLTVCVPVEFLHEVTME